MRVTMANFDRAKAACAESFSSDMKLRNQCAIDCGVALRSGSVQECVNREYAFAQDAAAVALERQHNLVLLGLVVVALVVAILWVRSRARA